MLKCLKKCSTVLPFEELFNVSTPFGSVFLYLFLKNEKNEHRVRIHDILSLACGFDVGKLLEFNNKKPKFERLPFDANWTHSKDLCVLAYSKDCLVGIDTEEIRPRNLQVAKRFFHAAEWEYLNSVYKDTSEKVISEEFFKLWCRKEAYFKCKGGNFFTDSLAVNMLEALPNGVFCTEWTQEFHKKKYQITLALSKK